MKKRPIILFVVNEAYFFVSHRLPISLEAQCQGYDVHVAAPADNVWAPEDFSVQQLAASGLTYHEIPISRRGTTFFQELGTFLALLRLYRRLRPDIVHHLTIKPNLYGGLAARLVGVPGVVYAITGLGHMFASNRGRLQLLRPMVLMLMRIAFGLGNKRVIVQNTSDREFLIGNGVVELGDTVLIQGSGVDLAQFKPSPEPAGEPVVVLPSRLIWEKGIQEFVDAATRRRQDPPCAAYSGGSRRGPQHAAAMRGGGGRQWR